MDTIANVLLYLFGIVLVIIPFFILWRFYQKANQPGWASLIPIYNLVVLHRIAGRPGWWVLLYFIPIVNIIATIVIALDIAKAFGKSGVFGVFGLFIFSIIGYAILAFGNDTYAQPVNA